MSAPAFCQIIINLNPKNSAIDVPDDSIKIKSSTSSSFILKLRWKKILGPSAIFQNDSASTLSLKGLSAGQYQFTLTAKNLAGTISKTDTAFVIVYPLPVVNAGKDTSIVGKNISYVVKGSAYVEMYNNQNNVKSYQWSQISGNTSAMADIDKQNLSLSNLDSGVYVFRLTIVGLRNTTNYDEVTVTIKPEKKPVEPPPVTDLKPRKIYALNDEENWVIKNIDSYPNYKVMIINEHGEMVFSSNSYTINPWRGDHKGKRANDGAYFYVIKDNNGGDVMKGSFLVVR